jgi:hypothetical protein
MTQFLGYKGIILEASRSFHLNVMVTIAHTKNNINNNNKAYSNLCLLLNKNK